MTHLTDPWINSREGLKEDDPTNRIISIQDMETYFKKVCEDYNINRVKDIHKYSEDLFKKAKKKLFE